MHIRRTIAATAATLAVAGGGIAAATQASADPGVANIGWMSSNHAGVKCVQQGLNSYFAAVGEHTRLAVDGLYGHSTEAAVWTYQREQHLHRDGIVGRQTGSYVVVWDHRYKYCKRNLPTN